MVGLGNRWGRPRNLEATELAKVKGKEIATATLRAGNILKNLIDAISDISDIDPAVHLSVLHDPYEEAKRYRELLARAADELLFRELPQLPTSEVPLLRFLEPRAEIPLHQAFKWANHHGYGGANHETVIQMVNMPYPFKRAYFNDKTYGKWSCYGIQGESGRTAQLVPYDETTLVSPGTLIIAFDHSVIRRQPINTPAADPNLAMAKKAINEALAGVAGNINRDDTIRALTAVQKKLPE